MDWLQLNQIYLGKNVDEIYNLFKKYLDNQYDIYYNNLNTVESDDEDKFNPEGEDNDPKKIGVKKSEKGKDVDYEIDKDSQILHEINPHQNVDYGNNSQSINLNGQHQDGQTALHQNFSYHSNSYFAIDRLCDIFSLSEFERFILLLCTATELRSDVSNLCLKATGMRFPTFELAFSLFEQSHWDAILPSSTLRSKRLIRIEKMTDRPWISCPIQIDERVLYYITGFSYLEKTLECFFIKKLDVPNVFTGAHKEIATSIVSFMHSFSNNCDVNENDNDDADIANSNSYYFSCESNLSYNNSYHKHQQNGNGIDDTKEENNKRMSCKTFFNVSSCCIQLIGEDELGKKIISNLICNDLRMDLWEINAESIPFRSDDLENFVSFWNRESCIFDCGLFISAKDVSDPNLKALIMRLVSSSSLKGPIFISVNTKWDSWDSYDGGKMIIYNVPKLSKFDQRKIWDQVLLKNIDKLSIYNKINYSDNINRIISHFDFTIYDILRCSNEILIKVNVLETKENINTCKNNTDILKNNIDTESEFVKLLWKSCRDAIQPYVGMLGKKISPTVSLEDLVIPQKEKKKLEEIIIQMKQRHKVYLEWGFGDAIENDGGISGGSSRGLGITALFVGESGTGKTMAAEAIANSLGLDLFKADFATLMDKYVGESEKQIKSCVQACQRSGSVFFIDEVHALASKQIGNPSTSNDVYNNIRVSYLLQLVEEYNGLAIFATNIKNALDPAFVRRMRFVVKFPFPDEISRMDIWKRAFPKLTPLDNIDFVKLSKFNMTGSSIRTIAMNATFLAAEDGTGVNMNHIKQSIFNEYDKLERPINPKEIE